MAEIDPTPPQTPSAAKVRVLPPFVFAGSFVTAVLITIVVHDWGIYRYQGVRAVLGALLLITAAALLATCLRSMRRTGQNPSPKTPTPSLIVTGPWKWSRNPIYLGMTIFEAGLGFTMNNLWIVLASFIALAIVHRTAVLPEEAYLTALFGDAYREYQQRVRRYL
jgi:protein-S-isoprenylcysteine O-methyltransferase Ste14